MSRAAHEYGPRRTPEQEYAVVREPYPELRGVYVPKHVRIYAEMIRTGCAILAVALNAVVLCRVFGLL